MYKRKLPFTLYFPICACLLSYMIGRVNKKERLTALSLFTIQLITHARAVSSFLYADTIKIYD